MARYTGQIAQIILSLAKRNSRHDIGLQFFCPTLISEAAECLSGMSITLAPADSLERPITGADPEIL